MLKRYSWIALWIFDIGLIFLQPRPAAQMPSFDVEAIRGPGGVEVVRPIVGQPSDALYFRVIGVDYGLGTEAPTEIVERDAGQNASTRVTLRQSVPTKEGAHIRIVPWWKRVVFPLALLTFFGSFAVAGLSLYAQKDLHFRKIRIRGWQWLVGTFLLFPLTADLTDSTTLILDNATATPVTVELNSYSTEIPASTRITATVAAYVDYRIVTRGPDGRSLDDATVQFQRNWINFFNVGRANRYELTSTSYRKR